MSVIIDTTKSELEEVIRYARDGANNCMIANSWEIKELVRCKDCIHNYVTTWNHGKRDKPQCHFTNLVRSNEFFCGFGEGGEANE